MSKPTSFTAEKIWRSIPNADRQAILNSVWCSHCRGSVAITGYALTIIAPDLLITGKCSACGNDIRRLVEMS